MKRSEALAPLSREHLKALLAARSLREAQDVETATAAFLEFWAAEHDHFRLEEEIVLPAWSAFGRPDEDAVRRVLDDHLAVRAAALRLEREGMSLEELHALGQRLHDHVRYEERSLFGRIEADLDGPELERVGEALARSERAE